jgi:hypothetical protein
MLTAKIIVKPALPVRNCPPKSTKIAKTIQVNMAKNNPKRHPPLEPNKIPNSIDDFERVDAMIPQIAPIGAYIMDIPTPSASEPKCIGITAIS